jgi:hypothetical protein
MGTYGEPVATQLDRARRATEATKAAADSLERSRLQQENERLRGEVFGLNQDKARATAAQADLAGKLAGQIHQQLTAAKPAAPQETAEQRSLRERVQAGKATTPELILAGLQGASIAPAAAPSASPASAPALSRPAELGGKSPTQLIQMGLGQQSKPAGGGQ